ncbi:MAG: PD-(D/E)XK nuclease family protein [Chloroflexi bacterium]|nr:PD-(D/E)XK nuclease family protein [Chloroflexota bacterium]
MAPADARTPSDSSNSDARAALRALVEDSDFRRLRKLLDRFNIFEAIGVVRQELRHSDLLAFFLDPKGSHGLGDAFVKRLLQEGLGLAGGAARTITPSDLADWSLGSASVLREWHNVDILVVDQPHRLTVVIENKIDSDEHSNQLKHYRDRVTDEYPGFHAVYFYLTPDGRRSSHPSYIPVSHELVCTVLERLVQERSSEVHPDVQTLMRHYTQMLRRHIVDEPEVADLCRQIYRDHRRALDLIFEQRPDRQSGIREILKLLIEERPDLRLNYSSKAESQFIPHAWDVAALEVPPTDHLSKRILLFYFWYPGDGLRLGLYLQRGPPERRQRLFAMGSERLPFNPTSKPLGSRSVAIYQRTYLTQSLLEEASTSTLEEEIRKQWDTFVNGDLVAITAAVADELRECQELHSS